MGRDSVLPAEKIKQILLGTQGFYLLNQNRGGIFNTAPGFDSKDSKGGKGDVGELRK